MSMPSGAWGFGSPGLVEAQTVIIEGSKGGLFVYSPSAGLGNLVLSIAATAGTDKYGNAYPAGETIFNTTFQIESSGQVRVKLDQFGNFLVFNSFGALIYLLAPGGDGWFLYADTGSAVQGGLIAAATSTAGTDQFGNAYVEGVSSYNPAIPGAWSRLEAGAVQVTDANAAAPATFNVFTIDNSVTLEGTLNTLADVAAVIKLYSDAQSGALSAPAVMIPNPGVILTGQNPTTGLPDPWNYVGSGGGQPAFGANWANRGGAFAKLAFRMQPNNSVWIKGWVTAGNVAATTLFTLPAGYRPVTNSGQTIVGFDVTGANAFQWNVASTGIVAPAGALAHTGNYYIDGFVSLDI